MMISVLAMSEQLLSVSEAAGVLGITRQAVLKAIKTGHLAAIKIGSYYAVRKSEVEKYVVSEEMRAVSLKRWGRKGEKK